jgi:hypothetical protein
MASFVVGKNGTLTKHSAAASVIDDAIVAHDLSASHAK